jgi:hypothetical protein
MLISIRSTNGGGKSTIVKTILCHYRGLPIFGLLGPKRPEAYSLRIPGVAKPVFILGPYHVASGGADQIQPYDLILDLLEKYAVQGHVLFEGVIVSSSYGRVGRLMERWGQEAVMAFLTTPLEQCIENVKKRRAEKGTDKEFNPKNLTSKFNQIKGSREKILAAGKLRVIDLDMGATAEIVELLRNAA